MKDNPTPVEEQLKFSKHWIRDWEKEYGVSLRKPNKRYPISKEDCVIQVTDYLYNIWLVRRYFLVHLNREPNIINGDQMPSHRNESADQKTMTFKNSETFVRENHHLSRERATFFTQISSDGSIFMPEYVFKGSGKRPPTLKTPEGMHYQCAPKGSYRLEQMVETIKRLPNKHNPFT